MQPGCTRQFITKFYSRLYIFSGISYHVACSQKRFRAVYKIEKIVQLVLFIWDNKQFQILLVVTFWETFYFWETFSSLSSEKWRQEKRRQSIQRSYWMCPGWPNSWFVPGFIQNISESQLSTLWSLAAFLSWKNNFPSQPFSISLNFISQWAFSRLQQPPENIPNAAKIFTVPRISECRAVLYSVVAGSKHWHFRQFSSELLRLLVLPIWMSALFTLAFLFWILLERERNQRTKWLAADYREVKSAMTRTSFSAACIILN